MKTFLVLIVFAISQINAESSSDIILFNTPRLVYTTLDPKYKNPPWGEWENCSNNEFVLAVIVRTETDAGYDDTSINAVCFYCAPLKGQLDRHNDSRKICSTVGRYGDFQTKPFECQYLLIGFQAATGMFMHPDQNKYGIVSIKFICSDQEDQEATSKKSFAYGKRQMCLPGQGVCGIRTQVDNFKQNKPDEAGLINMEIKCCDLPTPAHIEGFCQPKDSWQIVKECNNLRVNSSNTCEYQQSVGTTMMRTTSQTVSEQKSQEKMLSTTSGFESESAGIYKVDFSVTIEGTKGSETGFDWTTESSDTFSTMITTNVKFDVPALTKATLFQVVGECTPYQIRASLIVRVDSKVDGEVKPPKALPGGFFCDRHSSVGSSNAPDPVVGSNTPTTKPKPAIVITKKPKPKP